MTVFQVPLKDADIAAIRAYAEAHDLSGADVVRRLIKGELQWPLPVDIA